MQDRDELDLNRLLLPLRQQWKKVLLIWAAILSAAFLVVVQQRPEFVSSATIYVSDSKNSGGASTPLGSLSDILSEAGGSSDIESQKELIKGTDLAIRVMTRLGLNAEIEGDPGYLVRRPFFWQWRLAGRDPHLYNRGLKVIKSETDPDLYAPVEYRIQFHDGRSFKFINEEGDSPLFRLDQPIRTKEASFVLVYEGENEIKEGSRFNIKIIPPGLMAEQAIRRLSIRGGGKGGLKNNLIHVSYKSSSPYLSQAFLETLFQEFIAQNQLWATSVSRATLDFVKSQEEEIRAELDRSSSRLSQFQKDSGLVSLEPQLQADLKRLVDYEVQLRNQQLKLFELEKLVESLGGENPKGYLLPLAGDPLVQNMETRLSTLAAEIAALQSQFQDDYPPLKLLVAEQKALLSELKSTLQSSLNQARVSEKQLAKTVNEYKEKFEGLPEGSKSLMDYLRSTKVYEELFLFLLQEKQKAKIAEASTLSGIRVVDRAQLPLKESAPKVASTLMVSAAFGLFLAAGAVLLPALRVRWFTSVEEVKNHFPQPIFAYVPSRRKTAERATPAVLEPRSQSGFSESIRLLRTNLLQAMAGKKQQTVLITSALPGDGKTSIVANLATILIKSERVGRVLLIDADMHRPSIHGVFGLLLSPGLSDYLNGGASLEEIIRPVTLDDGKEIDVICAGSIPPTPVELIETRAMQQLLDDAQERYTFTLIDSTPYPLIASAAILAAKVDRILAILRIGHTDRTIFSRHLSDLVLINRNLGLVISTTEQGRFGYGYGYGYGYDGYDGHNGNGVSRSSESMFQRLKEKVGAYYKN